MVGTQGGRRKPAKKKNSRRNRKAAASIEESSSSSVSNADFEESEKLSRDSLLPNEIQGPGGRKARIEYDCCYSTNGKGNLPDGPPSYATVQKHRSGEFFSKSTDGEDGYVVEWHCVPGYYAKHKETQKYSPVKCGSSPYAKLLHNVDPFEIIRSMTFGHYHYEKPKDIPGCTIR